jgi:hypothetical protein
MFSAKDVSNHYSSKRLDSTRYPVEQRHCNCILKRPVIELLCNNNNSHIDDNATKNINDAVIQALIKKLKSNFSAI